MNEFSEKNSALQKAYQDAIRFANSHYENFPVVSLFLPKKIRKHVAVVYKFARQADDYADEGNFTHAERLTLLNEYENYFNNSLINTYKEEFWAALHNTIVEYNLEPQNFLNLLSAFKQDVVKKQYDTYEELIDYCSRSANPVGRIILEFFNIRDNESKNYSDAICTSLQLTNFCQDVTIDVTNGRIYIPLTEINNFNVELDQFQSKRFDDNFKNLLMHQVDRNRELFKIGRKLIPKLPKSLKAQIHMTVMGGEKILDKIASLDYDVLNSHPRLSKLDYAAIFLKAFLF